MLLTHILPMPVMLLAANRRSTGIGVRPRANRIEVTADFTPDAALMIATATFIVGVAREVMTWPSFELDELDSHATFPVRARLRARAAQLAPRMGRALLVVRRESVRRRRQRGDSGPTRGGETAVAARDRGTRHSILLAVDQPSSATRDRCA